MSFLAPKMSAPPMPPIPPVPPAAPISAPDTKVEDKLRATIKRRKGSSSTLMTSAAGLTVEPETSAMSLLGSAKEY
tara:strand:+ start:860 stop:1087 length:228 start_codon:yes stop_codon:yes gene_type:complete